MKFNDARMTESLSPEPFLVNKDSYPDRFEGVYHHAFVPKTLLQFGIILPFQIPVCEDSARHFVNDDDSISTYHFSTFISHYETSAGAIDEPLQSVELLRSRVEMVFVTAEALEWQEGPEAMTPMLSKYFDVLLNRLNQLLVAYLILTKDSDVHTVSLEMLQLVSLYRFVKLDEPEPWDTAKLGMLVLNPDVPYNRPPLTEEQDMRVSRYAHAQHNDLNPFILSEEMALAARRNFRKGFYRETVILAQISVETLLNTLFVQILVTEGASQIDAEAKVEDTAFKSMVQNQFHPRIGGRWNVEDANTQVGQWWADTYLLRNRVTHGGYKPTKGEVSDALVSAHQLRHYVASLLKKNKKKYPNLSHYLIVT